MSDRDERAVDAGMDRDELRVRLYELLDDKVEHERGWRLIRLGGGFAVTGAVVAYAIMTGELRFLSVAPLLYGVVIMAGLRSSVEILYLHRHMVRLESELRDREPLFGWVSEYGTFGDGQALYLYDVDLNVIPEAALYALTVAVYFLLAAIAVRAWRPMPSAAVPITREVLLFSYAVFSVVFLAIVAVGYLHFRRLADEVEAERSAGR